MQKNKLKKISANNIIEGIENILEDINYFKDLNSEDEIEAKLEKLAKYFKDDINIFLKNIFTESDNDYYRGITITELLKWSVDLNSIDSDIIKDCIDKSTIIPLKYGYDFWESYKKQSTYKHMDVTYMHLNFYELYINIDSFCDNTSELVKVLIRLKN